MRLFSLVNANYLKHVQHGIQTAHVLGRMCEKYKNDPVASQTISDYILVHETIIVLDGGNHQDLTEFALWLKTNESDLKRYPFAAFNESLQALNGAMTSVAVILPREIYEVEKPEPSGKLGGGGFLYSPYRLDGKSFYFHSPAEEQLYTHIKSKPLAR